MRRSLSIFAALTAAATANPLRTPTASEVRLLEESSYEYLGDVSGYNMEFGKCVRVKIPQNDDDEVEGNSYFVNGRYHAQYMQYASFFLCDNSDDSCGNCDYSVEYVTDLDTYLQEIVQHVQGMCGACAAQCRRRLEDEEQEEEEDNGGDYDGNVDCSTCANQCSTYNKNQGGTDETEYLDCQEAYEDGDIQYYSAPQCDGGGNIVIGLFYDEDCTVKTAASTDDYGFSYATFKTIEQSCLSCADGICEDLYDDSVHCIDGYNYNDNGDDEMPICRTYASAADREYSARKKQLTILPLVLFVLILVSSFITGAYVYFVRHNRKTTTPMANLDQTDLPPIT